VTFVLQRQKGRDFGRDTPAPPVTIVISTAFLSLLECDTLHSAVRSLIYCIHHTLNAAVLGLRPPWHRSAKYAVHLNIDTHSSLPSWPCDVIVLWGHPSACDVMVPRCVIYISQPLRAVFILTRHLDLG